MEPPVLLSPGRGSSRARPPSPTASPARKPTSPPRENGVLSGINTKAKVLVRAVGSDGEWEDRGTGFVDVETRDDNNVLVVQTSGGEPLLEEVLLDDIYTRCDKEIQWTAEAHGLVLRVHFSSARYSAVISAFIAHCFEVSDEVPLDVLSGCSTLSSYHVRLAIASPTPLERFLLAGALLQHHHLTTLLDMVPQPNTEVPQTMYEVFMAIVSLSSLPLFQLLLGAEENAVRLFRVILLPDRERLAGCVPKPSDDVRYFVPKACVLREQLAAWEKITPPAFRDDGVVRAQLRCGVRSRFLREEVLPRSCDPDLVSTLHQLEAGLRAGLVTYLREKDDLARVVFGGASLGASFERLRLAAHVASMVHSLPALSRGEVMGSLFEAGLFEMIEGTVEALESTLADRTPGGGKVSGMLQGLAMLLSECVSKHGMARCEEVVHCMRQRIMCKQHRRLAANLVRLHNINDDDPGDGDAVYHLLGLHDDEGEVTDRSRSAAVVSVRERFVKWFHHSKCLDFLLVPLRRPARYRPEVLIRVLSLVTACLRLHVPHREVILERLIFYKIIHRLSTTLVRPALQMPRFRVLAVATVQLISAALETNHPAVPPYLASHGVVDDLVRVVCPGYREGALPSAVLKLFHTIRGNPTASPIRDALCMGYGPLVEQIEPLRPLLAEWGESHRAKWTEQAEEEMARLQKLCSNRGHVASSPILSVSDAPCPSDVPTLPARSPSRGPSPVLSPPVELSPKRPWIGNEDSTVVLSLEPELDLDIIAKIDLITNMVHEELRAADAPTAPDDLSPVSGEPPRDSDPKRRVALQSLSTNTC